MSNIAISFTSSELKEKANALSIKLNLPVVALEISSYPLLLVVTAERLELRHTQEKLKPIYVDFLAGKLAHRHQYGGGRGQLIARAIGLKNKPTANVLDLTAGLGSDAFVLASLGCQVTMVERSPVICALLADGLERAQAAPWFKQLKLCLVEADASDYLANITNKPDVIYLDPMFPESKKTALVKKEMRMLKLLVGFDESAGKLVEMSLQVAKSRVVVKRALHAPTLSDLKPDLQYKGKSSRFDAYLVTQEAN